MEEEEMDQETLQKQNYLRENILNRGYDTNAFIDFLIGKKGEGGDDVANWSLPDLQNVVTEFISINEQNKIIEANQNQINEDINNNENANNNIEVNQNENEEKNIQEKTDETKQEKTEETKQEKKEETKQEKKEEINDWVDVDEKAKKNISKEMPKKASKEVRDTGGYGITSLKELKCQIVPNNEISKCDNIQIKVENIEKIEGKLFSKSYVLYTIVTLPLNWKVRRRFSDFDWLHQILSNNYNYCLIPAFQKKKNLNKIGTDKFDKAFLRKRKRKFELFLSYLINDPILKNTKVVYDFLSIQKEEDFQKKKKEYEKMKKSSNISDFLSLDGNANIEVNGEKELFINTIKENAQEHENILKKINTSIKGLKDDLINASDKLKEITANFKLLQKKAISFSEKDNAVKCYEELSSMFENLATYTSKQNYTIFITLREYLKFVKNNFRSMKDFIHTGENLKNNFYKALKSLKSKKEDLYKKPEAKWELDPKEKIDKKELLSNKTLALEKMLYKETANVNNQKQLYGFYLNRIITEYERMRNVNAERHLKKTLNIFQRLTEVTADFITSLTDSLDVLTQKQAKKKERKVKKEDNEEKLDLETPKQDNNNSNNKPSNQS